MTKDTMDRDEIQTFRANWLEQAQNCGIGGKIGEAFVYQQQTLTMVNEEEEEEYIRHNHISEKTLQQSHLEQNERKIK